MSDNEAAQVVEAQPTGVPQNDSASEAEQVRVGDVGTVSAAHEVLQGEGKRRGLIRLLPFMGPAFVASIAYMDPGNFATNIEGGAKYGYLLVWVIVASNLMAMLIQSLSAKLGIATGLNLAETCREQFPRPVTWGMWIISELVAMATDLAEFLGAALGFYLLFRIDLLPAAIITGITTFIILALERRGFRPLEAVITAMVGVIAVCYLIETILDRPDWGLIAFHAVTPQFADTESVLLAVGILGATVMPHVIFLHSALMQNRVVVKDEKQKKRLFRFELVDVMIAMGLAGLINAAMLIMAASTFHSSGVTEIAGIEDAYKTLTPLLGGAASTIFAISLLASGLSSSTVGTMAGQVIMQGYLRRKIPVWVRRLVTMIPALVVIALGFDPTDTLVLSQVILSFGIPFALIPLVMFTRRKDLMGSLVNLRVTTIVASAVATLIVALNLYLLYGTFFGE
ncbi:MAG TPA: Nramp family divalent metal transporter [Chloroflexia bacterium]|nr:Nramp family divalent metal transporter [Chloroflexia bacterium]